MGTRDPDIPEVLFLLVAARWSFRRSSQRRTDTGTASATLSLGRHREGRRELGGPLLRVSAVPTPSEQAADGLFLGATAAALASCYYRL